jgi:hypothetical protein
MKMASAACHVLRQTGFQVCDKWTLFTNQRFVRCIQHLRLARKFVDLGFRYHSIILPTQNCLIKVCTHIETYVVNRLLCLRIDCHNSASPLFALPSSGREEKEDCVHIIKQLLFLSKNFINGIEVRLE